MEFVVAIVAISASFLSFTAIILTYLRNRNRERLALIARDKDASIFRTSKKRSGGNKNLGVLLVFFGIGTFIGITLNSWGVISEEAAILGIVPAFIGLGILVINRMNEERDHDGHIDDEEV